MAGDDPWVAHKIMSVAVSAKAWATEDLCRLSPDCYFVPVVTLLAELSGFWSAAFSLLPQAAWRLQPRSLFTSHAIHSERRKPGCIHSNDCHRGVWTQIWGYDEFGAAVTPWIRGNETPFTLPVVNAPCLLAGSHAVFVNGRGCPSLEPRITSNKAEQRSLSRRVLTIFRAATGGCVSQDAALPCEEDPEAVQAPAAAGTAHIRRMVHVPAHQPGQDHQTPLQLRER